MLEAKDSKKSETKVIFCYFLARDRHVARTEFFGGASKNLGGG